MIASREIRRSDSELDKAQLAARLLRCVNALHEAPMHHEVAADELARSPDARSPDARSPGGTTPVASRSGSRLTERRGSSSRSISVHGDLKVRTCTCTHIHIYPTPLNGIPHTPHARLQLWLLAHTPLVSNSGPGQGLIPLELATGCTHASCVFNPPCGTAEPLPPLRRQAAGECL